MNPIHIPEQWANNSLLAFEEFCELIGTTQRTVQDWRKRAFGARWACFDRCGRLYFTVAGARRLLLSSASANRAQDRAQDRANG